MIFSSHLVHISLICKTIFLDFSGLIRGFSKIEKQRSFAQYWDKGTLITITTTLELGDRCLYLSYKRSYITGLLSWPFTSQVAQRWADQCMPGHDHSRNVGKKEKKDRKQND